MKNQLEYMLRDGFSKKFATYYLNALEHEKQSGLFDKNYMKWCHSHGFLAESGIAYSLNEKNIGDYLSDYDYYRSWPLNDWQRIWINDKLTLKYMLSGTKFDKYMPRYFYYSSSGYGLRSLVDNPYDNSFNSFFSLLREQKVFACKPCNGAGALGFVKLEYINDDQYLFNSIAKTKGEIIDFINAHPNYVFTEFITPHTSLKEIDDKIQTIRIIVVNEDGLHPRIVGGYMRFGHKEQGGSNYLHTDDSMNIYSGIDFVSGCFGNTKAVYVNMIEELEYHPDSGKKLSGTLPHFEEMCSGIIEIARLFFAMEFAGFDVGITEGGIKIMEINTHPGITIPQVFRPYYTDEKTAAYFKKKLARIDGFTQEQRTQRNFLPR